MKERKLLSHYLLLILLVPLITIILLELTSLVWLYFLNDRRISRAEIQRTLAQSKIKDHKGIVLRDSSPVWMRTHVLHPYLGFVRNYDHKQNVFNGYVIKDPVNKFGFFGPTPRKGKDEERISVVIMGGSVAAELFLYGRDILHDRLKALPFSENIPFQVSPFYPRRWIAYSSKAFSGKTVMLIGAIYEKKKELEKWRKIASATPFYYSNFSLAIWYGLGKKIKAERLVLEEELTVSMKKSQRRGAQEQRYWTYLIGLALFGGIYILQRFRKD